MEIEAVKNEKVLGDLILSVPTFHSVVEGGEESPAGNDKIDDIKNQKEATKQSLLMQAISPISSEGRSDWLAQKVKEMEQD